MKQGNALKWYFPKCPKQSSPLIPKKHHVITVNEPSIIEMLKYEKSCLFSSLTDNNSLCIDRTFDNLINRLSTSGSELFLPCLKAVSFTLVLIPSHLFQCNLFSLEDVRLPAWTELFSFVNKKKRLNLFQTELCNLFKYFCHLFAGCLLLAVDD